MNQKIMGIWGTVGVCDGVLFLVFKGRLFFFQKII